MPRHYSEDEKRQILERLVANRGDVSRTASETGITSTTIYRWLKHRELQQINDSHLQHLQFLQHLSSDAPSQTLPLSNALERGSGGEVNTTTQPLPADLSESLLGIRHEMLDVVGYLLKTIIPAIEEAPLNQRVAALVQLTDRIFKMGLQIPSEPVEVIIHNVVDKEENNEDGFDPAEDSSQSEEGYPMR